MSDRLRSLLERPIAERDRERLFALAALTLLLAAAALTLTRPSGSSERTRSTSPVPRLASVPARTSAVAGPPARVLDAGRRFLAGYLPYLYGQAPGRSILAASTALRRQLAHIPPSVAPAMRARDPHVVKLEGHGLATGSQWALTATVSDRTARYPVQLVVADGGARPVVIALGED